MSRFLVSVGGSGQHAALAVLRLAHLRALPGDITLIALDADDKQPLSETLKVPWRGADGAGAHPLRLDKIHPPFDRVAKGGDTFRDIFVDVNHPMERELFEMLFDQHEEEIEITRGMYGTPCVGAAVFSDSAEDQALRDLLAGLTRAKEVFFTGSVVGGTGAGILHKLVARVKEKAPKDLTLYGIFFLPWFSVPHGGGKGAVTPAVIQRNLDHGLAYFFDHTVPLLNASVFLGQPSKRSGVLKDIHLQHGDMSEHPHFIHLVAARCILDLPGAYTANTAVKAYGFAHDEAREGWLLDLPWHDGRTLRALADCAAVQVALLDHLATNARSIKDTIKGGIRGIFASPTAITEQLYSSIVQNAQALKRPKEAFATEVLSEFDRIRESLIFCLRWLRMVLGDSLIESKHNLVLGLARNDPPHKWNTLRGWWKPVLPGPDGAVAPGNVARQLVDQIRDEAIKVLSAGAPA